MGTIIGLGLLLPIAIGCIAAAVMYWVLASGIQAGVTAGLSRSTIKLQGNNASTRTPEPAPDGFVWVLVPTTALPHFADPHNRPMPDMRAD
ncbi:hypothetical protein AVMA1855_02845 [Acidovorax sp. SUPP1855]|uniref:hypothetical protein n=1 Tax=Acidovorax sp. SUPP1855 TaxID=431774 RepID=UPI0023DE5D99|nr:hypothetical protein [Acidovorax sp. SUPP1855]GKS83043.1 hypothetical protein AVMA1855_02845 [Acidovorax sp. SUPP1855]